MRLNVGGEMLKWLPTGPFCSRGRIRPRFIATGLSRACACCTVGVLENRGHPCGSLDEMVPPEAVRLDRSLPPGD